jgi:hypothetical protein
MYWMGLFVVLTGCEQITGQKDDDDTEYSISSISSGASPTVSGTYSWGGSPSPTLRAENLSVTDGGNIYFNLVPSASVAVNFAVPFKTGSYPISSSTTDFPAGTARLLPNITSSPGVTGTVVVTEASVARTDRSRGIVRLGVTVNATVRNVAFTGPATTPVVGTFNILFDNRSDPPYQPPTSGGGTLNLVCPGSLPTGYQCLQTGAQQAPGRFNIQALHGTWVEANAQVCMTLSNTGASSFKYRSGFPAGSGTWGALVTRTGAFQPASGPYYVFTGANDPQISLLTFDESSNPPRFIGWGFAKGSCPW